MGFSNLGGQHWGYRGREGEAEQHQVLAVEDGSCRELGDVLLQCHSKKLVGALHCR